MYIFFHSTRLMMEPWIIRVDHLLHEFFKFQDILRFWLRYLDSAPPDWRLPVSKSVAQGDEGARQDESPNLSVPCGGWHLKSCYQAAQDGIPQVCVHARNEALFHTSKRRCTSWWVCRAQCAMRRKIDHGLWPSCWGQGIPDVWRQWHHFCLTAFHESCKRGTPRQEPAFVFDFRMMTIHTLWLICWGGVSRVFACKKSSICTVMFRSSTWRARWNESPNFCVCHAMQRMTPNILWPSCLTSFLTCVVVSECGL